MKNPPSESSPVGYSYVRFSTSEQRKGDSLRRQTEAAADWCKANDVQLDTSLTLHDLGKSAFRGAHHKDDRHALGAFIRLAESGRVPAGSFLIIERLDRLTREQVDDALELFLRLKKLVRIVQLKPVPIVHDRQSSPMQLMMALVELMRGRDESEAKSERGEAAWTAKRQAAREGKSQPPRKKDGRITRSLTDRLPAWVRECAGKLELIPDRAATVKYIFELAAAGYGQTRIAKKLTDEKVPAFGENVVREGSKRSAFSGKWLRAYIALLLRDRRVVGELVPGIRTGKPQEPIPGYYPAAIKEDLWNLARAGAGQRDRMPGRKRAGGGKFVHLFNGLLRDARDGGGFFIHYRGGRGEGGRFLINANGFQGHTDVVTFHLDTFERAILSCLQEIDPHSILNGDAPPDETIALSAELARVEVRIGELEAELINGDVAALARVLRHLEEQKKELGARLAEARIKAAHPASESWGEAQSLIAALDKAPDPTDARMRLRSALRRIISEIVLLIVPRGGHRLCAAQVWFTSGERQRSFLIYRPHGNTRKRLNLAGWTVLSFADIATEGDFDLRRKEDVAELEQFLVDLPLNDLDGVE